MAAEPASLPRSAALGACRYRHMVYVDYGATGNFGAVALTGDGAGAAVAVRRIDELELARCDLVKADVARRTREPAR